MAITTAPTAAMKLIIKNDFIARFGTGGSAPATEDGIATGMGELIANAIELALIEVKDNAKAVDGTAGGDLLDVT